MAVLERNCQNLKCLCVCSLYLLILGLLINYVDCKKTPECSTCKEIVDNFHKGLSNTEKSGYGGGNTNWEENSLGSYALSEVRLTEIIENLCEGKSKECHTLLEEHEELVESFWFKHFAKKNNKDLYIFLCIENIRACCHNNTYGKDCEPCPGGINNPCHGNGKCDGAGTRKGTGKCRCSAGYTGDLCTDCRDGYFKANINETHDVCKVCHISCKGSCSGEGPKACDECKDGWESNDKDGCLDINECLEEPCEDNQYCTNTQGSYTCFSCDSACTSCTGAGPHKCNDCKEGYVKLEGGKCEDKDECSADSSLCSKLNEECVNTPGSYECICSSGYEYKDSECVKVPKGRSKVIKTEEIQYADRLKEQFGRYKDALDWSKFKDNPSLLDDDDDTDTAEEKGDDTIEREDNDTTEEEGDDMAEKKDEKIKNKEEL